MDVADTFLHLRGADVLVHTGSSFVAAAAISAPGPQVYFQSPPKEAAFGAYAHATQALQAALHVTDTGRLSPNQSFPAQPSSDTRGSGGGARDLRAARLLQGLYALKYGDEQGLQATSAAAAAELRAFMAFKVGAGFQPLQNACPLGEPPSNFGFGSESRFDGGAGLSTVDTLRRRVVLAAHGSIMKQLQSVQRVSWWVGG